MSTIPPYVFTPYVLQTAADIASNRFSQDAYGMTVRDTENRIVRPVLFEDVERTIAAADLRDHDLNYPMRLELDRVLDAADEIGFRLGSVQGLGGRQVQVHGESLGSVSTAQAVALIERWAAMTPNIERSHFPAKDGGHHAFSTVHATENGVTIKVFTEFSADQDFALGADAEDTTDGAP